jgi:hypothetical protein
MERKKTEASNAMLIARARRDALARILMVSAVEDAEQQGFQIDFVPRPCCRYPGSHLDSAERAIHILTHETDVTGEWRARPDISIAISLAHEVGHALDPPTAADQSLTDRAAIQVRRLERESTAWSYVEVKITQLKLPDSVSQEFAAQRERARIAYDESLGFAAR